MLVTVRELSQQLKLHRGQIYTLIHEGKIPFFRIGGAYRFDLGEVLDRARSKRDSREVRGEDGEENGHERGSVRRR